MARVTVREGVRLKVTEIAVTSRRWCSWSNYTAHDAAHSTAHASSDGASSDGAGGS